MAAARALPSARFCSCRGGAPARIAALRSAGIGEDAAGRGGAVLHALACSAHRAARHSVGAPAASLMQPPGESHRSSPATALQASRCLSARPTLRDARPAVPHIRSLLHTLLPRAAATCVAAASSHSKHGAAAAQGSSKRLQRYKTNKCLLMSRPPLKSTAREISENAAAAPSAAPSRPTARQESEKWVE